MSTVNRKCHCLKAEKTLAMPRHIIFFDTETKTVVGREQERKQVLKLGWVCYYRRAYGRHKDFTDWFEFFDALSFWQFLYKHTEKKRKLWVIARNIVFDFTIVEGWKYLRQAGFKLKFFHNSGLTSVVSVRGRFGSIIFCDSGNWFRESVEATGQRIGLPKLKIDFDTCTDAELSTYCHRDTEIELENFKQFIRFLEGNKISRLCYTIGSTAMAAYLYGFYRRKIWIHNNTEAINLERDSFRGGRVECFYLGEKKNEYSYFVDVNSLYPFVMRNNLFPVKYKKILHNPSDRTLRDYLQVFSVVAKVLIETDEPAYAVRHGWTIFPVGRFWVTLTTPELKYAFDAGHIKKIKDCILYEQSGIFKKYVDKFYALRQDFRSAGVESYAEICKLLLNSLYGKFGQKAEVWEKIGDCPNERDRVEDCFVADLGRRTQIRYLLGEIFELTGHEECFNSFPAVAAHVTAYGRLHLYELMKTAGEGNYFYCDTDSLIINEVGLCKLQNQIEPDVLGRLKIVERSDDLTIRGLKDYSTGTKTVVKGIRKNATKLSDGEYQQQQWPSFKGLLRSNDVNVYTIKETTKVLNREYHKGTVTNSGVVLPLVLDEPAEYFPQLL